MDGLMMQVPLTLVHFLDRARRYFAAARFDSVRRCAATRSIARRSSISASRSWARARR